MKRSRPGCNHTECDERAEALLFVPFATCDGGLVARYCTKHAKEARSMGAKSVVLGSNMVLADSKESA